MLEMVLSSVLIFAAQLLTVPVGAPAPAPSAAPVAIGNAEIEEAYLGQSGAVAASDGETHMVVWTDYRAGSYWSDVMMARISGDGVLLDPVNRTLGATGAAEFSPAVCWTGENYFAAWTEYGASRIAVRGATIDRDGNVGESSILLGARAWTEPLVAANGSSVAVAARGGEGVVLLEGGVQRRSVVTSFYIEEVVALGSGFAAVGTRADGCPNCTTGRAFFSFFDGVGNVERRGEFAIYDGGVRIRAASNGQMMIAGVFDGRETKLFAISREGTTRPVGTLDVYASPVLTWDGAQFLAVASSPDGATVKSFDADGVPLQTRALELEHPFHITAVSSSRRGVLLSGDDVPESPPYRTGAIRGVLLNDAREVEISRSAAMQFGAVALPAASGYFAAWLETVNIAPHQFHRGLPSRVMAAHLDRAGRPERPVVIADAAADRASLSVASGPLGEMVLWEEGGNIRAVRMSPGGERAGLTLPWSGRAGVVQRSADHLVAFTSDGIETVGVRIGADGTVLDSVPLPLGRGGQTPRLLQVASTTLLATASYVPPCQTLCLEAPPPEMHVRRIAANGTIAGELLVAEASSQPTIACGDRCLVAWRGGDSLGFRTFGSDLQNPSPIVTLPRHSLDDPSVAWNGREFVLAWTEGRSESTIAVVMSVSSTGEPSAPVEMIENRAMEGEHIYSFSPEPFVVSGGRGTTIVLYGQHDSRVGGVKRLFSRLLGSETRRRSVRR